MVHRCCQAGGRNGFVFHVHTKGNGYGLRAFCMKGNAYIVPNEGTPEGGSKCLIGTACVLTRCSSSAGLWWMLAYMYAESGGISGRLDYMH